MSKHSKYNRARLDDRQITELIGIARGLIADGHLHDKEIEFLQGWLAATEGLTRNPVVAILFQRIEDALSDGVIDFDERADLFEALERFTANNFEIGEVLKATTLPLCHPAPTVIFPKNRFTFTGTCVFGSRNQCEAAVADLGGVGGSLRQDTKYLVIGEYASDDWVQSSYGRKIEQAVELRKSGFPIQIISEAHWYDAM